ncbi:UNVERIFIED_CONTAM: hypothetical protein K2H54_062554 [Gekko kuhli]
MVGRWVKAQAGWLQHDFGHLSVFKKSTWNHLVHKFVIGHLKGASANWWNHRHFQHHAKPNILKKDPDVNMLHLFVLGDTQPVECNENKMAATRTNADLEASGGNDLLDYLRSMKKGLHEKMASLSTTLEDIKYALAIIAQKEDRAKNISLKLQDETKAQKRENRAYMNVFLS